MAPNNDNNLAERLARCEALTASLWRSLVYKAGSSSVRQVHEDILLGRMRAGPLKQCAVAVRSMAIALEHLRDRAQQLVRCSLASKAPVPAADADLACRPTDFLALRAELVACQDALGDLQQDDIIGTQLHRLDTCMRIALERRIRQSTCKHGPVT